MASHFTLLDWCVLAAYFVGTMGSASTSSGRTRRPRASRRPIARCRVGSAGCRFSPPT